MGCKSVIWLCVAEMLFSPREKTVDSAALAVKVGNSCACLHVHTGSLYICESG